MQKQLIKIQTDMDKGGREIQAEVLESELICIHKQIAIDPTTKEVLFRSNWTVTHVPTGRCFGTFATKALAKSIALMIQEKCGDKLNFKNIRSAKKIVGKELIDMIRAKRCY